MDLVGVQEGSGGLESGNYTLFFGEGNANHQFIGELNPEWGVEEASQ